MGGQGLDQALRERGLEPVTEPCRRRGRGGPGLRPGHASGSRSCRARSWSAPGCPWVASNTDMTIPTRDRGGPGNGTLVRMVAEFAEREPQVAGKPKRPLFEETLTGSGASARW